MLDEDSRERPRAPAVARFLFRVNVWAFVISITLFLALHLLLYVVPTGGACEFRPAFGSVYLAAACLTLFLLPIDLAFCIVARASASRLGERSTATLSAALWSLAMTFVAAILFLSSFMPTF